MREALNLEGRVGYAIKRAQHAQRVAMDKALRDLGLTAAQWGTLMCLAYHEDLSNADLARVNDCTPQSMNSIVLHLEEAGLVERHRHATHGTLLPTRLTVTGRSLLQKSLARVDALEVRMLAPLSDLERSQLTELLNRCIVALHDDSVCAGDGALE